MFWMFLQYLWGIETVTNSPFYNSTMAVFTVPMRNWNLSFFIPPFYFLLSFLQYLWGIETPERFRSFWLYCIVFTVPMRNWNTSVVTPIRRLYQSVFTVPMRNWNKVKGIIYNYAIYGFYSTYEELKLARLKSFATFWTVFLQYLWGIETWTPSKSSTLATSVFTVPMRNWNISVAVSVAHFEEGFYSTYEELKLCNVSVATIYTITFLQYLWGIETAPCAYCKYTCNVFLQYLWGIETHIF